MGGTRNKEDSDEVKGLIGTIHKFDAENFALKRKLTRILGVVHAHFDGDDGELSRAQSARIALDSIKTILNGE